MRQNLPPGRKPGRKQRRSNQRGTCCERAIRLTLESRLSSQPVRLDVVIVGGGFSAACLAIQFLRNSRQRLSIAIVNREEKIARGVAYRTECDAHLLNVPAAKMSILAEEPDHFLSWLAPRHSYTGQDFVPRRIYGEYIEASLEAAIAESGGATVQWIAGSAVSLALDAQGVALQLESGGQLLARIAVLAIGNSPPVSPACFVSLSSDRYKSNAWATDAHLKIGSTDAVLVVGTGLTAIDQILKLSREDHAGTIYVLSRRGKLPALHEPAPPWPSDWTRTLPCDILTIFREVRRQIALAAAVGADWRSVIDSLRQATPKIWQSLNPEEKKRFIRHVRPYWEISRHRIPTSTHSELERLMRENRMVLLSGRVGDAAEREGCVEVAYLDRDTAEPRVLRVDRVVNCTGPGTVSRVRDELLDCLLDQRLARVDCLGLGIETGTDGAVIGADGEPSKILFAIGPVRKASLWESTAVPEIRVQAKELATLLIEMVKVN